MFKIICITWILTILYKNSTSQLTKIDPTLASKLQNGETANIVVTFNNGVQSTIESVKSLRFGDRSTRNNAIVDALRKNAEATQQGVVQTLSTRSGGGFSYFKSYWTSNKIFIKEADVTTVNSIAEDDQVAGIRLATSSKLEDINYADADDASVGTEDNPQPNYPYWNLDRMQVNETHAELGGSKGEGIIVGAIDSGAKVLHEQLKDSYVGEYGWYDGVNGTLESYDYIGHGSNVIGIIVGPECGVAPGVKWMVCQACIHKDDCPFEAIMNCIQFMSCPTLPDGSQQDCSKAPHVVNFSIAGERDGEPYDQDFLTMKELGIIPVAGIGNSGPFCRSDRSAGNKPYVIGVGASNVISEVWAGSSHGPAPDGTIKPDFLAPGVFIISVDALSESDSKLTIGLGTSTATPHVTAVVALLHVRNPEITFEEAYEFLKQGANPDVTVTSYIQSNCNESFAVTPNNLFGYGIVSALETIKAQSAAIAGTKKL